MTNDFQAYFDSLAIHLCGDLASTQHIEAFVANSTVIGAYAEAKVMSLLSRIFYPLRLCTGSIISPESFSAPKDRPQIDVIVWDSNPLPAIFEEGNFALVPKNSVIGAFEVKRNDYPAGLDDINNRFTFMESEFPRTPETPQRFMGIVCVRETHLPNRDNKLTRLINENKAVYLIDYSDGKATVNPDGVFRLVNFIGGLRNYHKVRSAEFTVPYPPCSTETAQPCVGADPQ